MVYIYENMRIAHGRSMFYMFLNKNEKHVLLDCNMHIMHGKW